MTNCNAKFKFKRNDSWNENKQFLENKTIYKTVTYASDHI